MTQKLTTEIVYQKANEDFNNSFTVILPSKKASKIIDFLKDRRHWYSKENPEGGVDIPSKDYNQIHNKWHFLPIENKKYTSIIGFRPLNETSKSAFLGVSISHNNKIICVYDLPQTLDRFYSIFDMDDRKIEIRNIGTLIDIIKEGGYLPFVLPESLFESEYSFHLAKFNFSDFIIGHDYAEGI